MLEDFHIDGFRSFAALNIAPLARVNLFVGKNNCGKTSILEALQLLATDGDWNTLAQGMYRRGERLVLESDDRPTPAFDVRHLFHGRDAHYGTGFKLFSHAGSRLLRLSLRLDPPDELPESQQKLFELSDSASWYALTRDSGMPDGQDVVPVSSDLTFSWDAIRRRRSSVVDKEGASPQFVTTESLSSEQAATLWSSVALTPEEDRIVEALRILEPDLERVGFVGFDYSRPRLMRSREGIMVRLLSTDTRVPIGNLGDGMWRLLSLTLAMTRAAGSVLLVDEIDTGLHYTALRDMWRLVLATARRLDLQVFATTHSLDCVTSLGALCEEMPDYSRDVMLHRIERGMMDSVPVPGHQLATAAMRDIELR